MRPRSLLILFLVVAGLGAFVWFYERELPSTDERAEQAKKVLPVEAEKITELVIESTGVRLVRAEDEDAEGWDLVEPMSARADGSVVDRVVRRLVGLDKERTLEVLDAAEMGLAEPRNRVRLRGEDGEWALMVGADVPATSNLILGVEGRTEAYVVAAGFVSDLDKVPGDWRSRDAFPYAREAVSKIRLQGRSGDTDEVVLEKLGEDFRLASPIVDEVDEDEISELLDAITGLEIESFIDDPGDPDVYGLDEPTATVRVSVGTDKEIEIRLGSAKPDDEDLLYASVDEVVFETDTDLAELAAEPAAGWQSRSWSRFEVFEIDRVRLTEGDNELHLERASGDWLRGGEKIAYTTASDVLYAVDGVEAESVVAAAEILPAEPLLELVLTIDEREERLTLYTEVAGLYPAARAGRDQLLMLTRESVDELRRKIQAARDAEPVVTPEEGDRDESDQDETDQ